MRDEETMPIIERARGSNGSFVGVTSLSVCEPINQLQAKLRQAFREFQDDSFDEFRELWKRVKVATAEASYPRTHLRPAPPKPILPASDCISLPDRPGIYFVWSGDRVVYVGQSIKLSSRCHLKRHDKIKDEDWISWLEMPAADLYFAECFYIGILQPERNSRFGVIPTHARNGEEAA